MLMVVMNMRLWLISIVLFALTFPCRGADNSDADTVSIEQAMRYKEFWQGLIPNQTVVQYAGSIGIMSFGMGWHYYKDKWETELLLGWVPANSTSETMPSFTIKQRFIPWHFKLNDNFVLEPFTTGLFFNTIFGENFWRKEPSKYPSSYYGFPTNIRTNVFIGQRLKFDIPSNKRKYNKSISLYYELSTCDLYIVSYALNKRISIDDILSLAIGLRFEIF